MPEKKKYLLAVGQVWTIGKKTRDDNEYLLNRLGKISNKPEVKLGLECVIERLEGNWIYVKDLKTGEIYQVKSQGLGKRIK
jgi:hypothetical protein